MMAWREDNRRREANCCTGSGMRHKQEVHYAWDEWWGGEEGIKAEEAGQGEIQKDLNAKPVSWYFIPRQQEANKDFEAVNDYGQVCDITRAVV